MTIKQPPIEHSDLRTFVEDNNIHSFKMGAVDLDGLWRGKRVAADYFVESVAQTGSFMCNILFGWDLQDIPIPNLKYTGSHTGYPDVNVRPDMSTLRLVPWEPGVASVICDVFERDGTPAVHSPRQILRSMIERSEAMGLKPVVAYEFEFYLLRGSANELELRGWRDLEPISQGHHTYSIDRDAGTEFLMGDVRRQLADYGVHIEASNSEHGPGQYEVNIHYGDALKAADSAMLLKHTVKEIAAQHGYTATFIAKLKSEWAGSSGHVHLSMVDEEGTPVFSNPEDPGNLSEIGSRFMAGLIANGPAFVPIYLPTTNSYKRVATADWAPTTMTWGVDNRTVAIRSIPSAGTPARVENRMAGADANPYLVIAASLASGLDGIVNELVPPERIVGDGYANLDEKTTAVTMTLADAVNEFTASEVTRKYFGDEFVEHYAALRRWEIEKAAAAVTDWEIARYLEHI
jgi:glutamine synthetase